jgi:DNA-binding GntR family transcriptional regulator
MSSDLNSRLPLYAQVENVIISRISNGSLPPGTRLPSEESLVQEYAVSRTTIRAAIQSLVQRGLVEIRRGKGTFVTHPKITQELTELTGFVEDMQALGRHATAKVLDQQVVAATQVVARQLALPQGAPVVRIQRVRLGDGIPLSFDQTYLPKELGEKVIGIPKGVSQQILTESTRLWIRQPVLSLEVSFESADLPADIGRATQGQPDFHPDLVYFRRKNNRAGQPDFSRITASTVK